MAEFEFIPPPKVDPPSFPMRYNETAYEAHRGHHDSDTPLEPFCLLAAPTGKTGIVYGVVLEQGAMDDNPTVHEPIEFAGFSFGDVIDLPWEGNVYITWIFTADGVGDVHMVGPSAPTNFVPYDPDSTPPVGKTTGYFMLIGNVDTDGFHQKWTGNIIVPSFQKTIGTHSWKITRTTAVDGKVNVRGGKVASQGCFGSAYLTMPDTENLVVSDGSFIYLSIVRDSSTREVVSLSVSSNTVEQFSDETTQYVELGNVALTAGKVTYIHQTQFEDLNIFEDLAVVNGEFQFVSLLMAGKNYYVPPAP